MGSSVRVDHQPFHNPSKSPPGLEWFRKEKKSFGDWLTEKETILTEMTLVRVETKDDILSRAKELKVLEQDLEVQHKEFDRLNNAAQALANSLNQNQY
ncbi:hypothetical protein BSL78_28376 [Apostichopus japonicus]|uniref:Uncharacterized protein n=1 Tax=Stichopus japonicus TaxID=307972 RepID=A0A2G8JGC5_STIJA|nr:hypothetical protein BSL78_28376 [Apostichopus japonicus]